MADSTEMMTDDLVDDFATDVLAPDQQQTGHRHSSRTTNQAEQPISSSARRSQELLSGVFDPELFSPLADDLDLNCLQAGLDRVTASLRPTPASVDRVGTEAVLEFVQQRGRDDTHRRADQVDQVDRSQRQNSLPVEPSVEQVLHWLQLPEVRQAIFALVTEEALKAGSPLGRALGFTSDQ